MIILRTKEISQGLVTLLCVGCLVVKKKFYRLFLVCVAFCSEVKHLTKGAFFWDYAGIGKLGLDGICVLLAAIPFSD